ncbi:MAG: LptF/LptG family permease [Akkermansiaceae bacterium]
MIKVPRWLLPLFLFLLGAAATGFIFPHEKSAVAEQMGGFPDSDYFSHQLRPFILAFLCFMPAIAAAIYALGTTFDRYLSRQFLTIFAICIGALFTLWMLLDLNDNLGDFSDSPNMAKTVLFFYVYRAPAILLVLLPYSLLLANIYCLGKLSKSNEIIAMIQSGSGIVRTSAPLVFAGLWCSALLLALNYHWAPHAEGKRDGMLALAQGRPVLEAKNVLYRDPESQRLWMVGAFPEDFQKGKALQNVEITTLRADGSIKSRMSSAEATYSRASREWKFTSPTIAKFTKGEAPIFERKDETIVKRNWKETPSQIIKPGLDVAFLGIPELKTWLQSPLATQTTSNLPAYLTHWHYRWALPITCLVTVLLAAPLSIHFARRGAGSGVFLAVVLSVLMIFLSTVTLALGESGSLDPFIAAWLPNIVFTVVGLYLYHRRISGRPIYQSIKRLLPINQ